MCRGRLRGEGGRGVRGIGGEVEGVHTLVGLKGGIDIGIGMAFLGLGLGLIEDGGIGILFG
jgi:hypothetical protein